LRSPTRDYVRYEAWYDEERRSSLRVSSPQTWGRLPEPDLREHDLLRFPPGTRIVQDDGLVANRDRTKLYVVTDGRVLGVVDLARRAVRIRSVDPAGPIADFTRPVLVGEATAAWLIEERPEIAFLDLRSGRIRVRRVGSEDCRLAPASRLVLSYRCEGITAFDAHGRVRFRVLRNDSVSAAQATDTYAYVTLAGRNPEGMSFAVVDLRAGRVVREVNFAGSVGLLVGSLTLY
jgi:hypothetical protein